MADLVITAANVAPTGNTTIKHGIAAVAITAGQAVYLDAATNTYKLGDCDSGTAADKDCDGIALNGAAAGQPLAVGTGPVDLGAILTAGDAYYLSDTAGGIKPSADLGVGDDVVFLGHATSTSLLNVRPDVTGVTL